MASPLRFLHGAETNVTIDGPVFFQAVNSAVVGLVGTAPVHLLDEARRTPNVLELVYSDRRAARLFGPHRPGFTLPSALRAIYAKTGAQALVVNIFDPDRHKTDVAAADKTFAGGVIQLPHRDITAIAVSNEGEDVTYTQGADYEIDRVRGRISRLASGAIARGAVVRVAYSYADLTLVTSADIIGTVDAAGRRSGIELLKDSLIKFGRKPKLLGAPGFSSSVEVRNALQAMAHKQRGHCFIDAPVGLTPARAIAARGPAGSAPAFFTSDHRTMLCYPHVQEYDPVQDKTVLAPLSQHLIGLAAQVQAQLGLQHSPSNKEILGIAGVEIPLSSDFTDPDSEVNLLNEIGITTVYRGYGTGNRSWGNRTAAWPVSTHVSTFLAVQRVGDMIAETLEFNSLQFVDRPLTIGLIDSVVKSVQAFLGRLKNDGVILGGQVWFEADDNEQTQLSAGWIRFRVDQQPPPPAERLSYEQRYNIGYLADLAREAAATYGRAA